MTELLADHIANVRKAFGEAGAPPPSEARANYLRWDRPGVTADGRTVNLPVIYRASSAGWGSLDAYWLAADGQPDHLFAPKQYDHLDRMVRDLLGFLAAGVDGRPAAVLEQLGQPMSSPTTRRVDQGPIKARRDGPMTSPDEHRCPDTFTDDGPRCTLPAGHPGDHIPTPEDRERYGLVAWVQDDELADPAPLIPGLAEELGAAAARMQADEADDGPRTLTCRTCGAEDSARSIEDLQGTCSIVGINADGEPEFSGETEVHWGSSTTTAYECRYCLAPGELRDLFDVEGGWPTVPPLPERTLPAFTFDEGTARQHLADMDPDELPAIWYESPARCIEQMVYDFTDGDHPCISKPEGHDLIVWPLIYDADPDNVMVGVSRPHPLPTIVAIPMDWDDVLPGGAGDGDTLTPQQVVDALQMMVEIANRLMEQEAGR